MKNLKSILLILLVKTIFIACEPVNTFVSPSLQEKGNFVDKNRQWLIDNSPFYTMSLNMENHIFSIAFLDNDVLEFKECVNGNVSTEYGSWSMRFSDRTRIDDLVSFRDNVIKSTYTGFCSPIIRLNPESKLVFIQQTLYSKKNLEENFDFYRRNAYDPLKEDDTEFVESKIKIESFKFGGEDNTIELSPLVGYVLKNPNTGEIVLYSTSTFYPDENTRYNPGVKEISYSFRENSDVFLGRFRNNSYLDEWGYINMCSIPKNPEENYSPWYNFAFYSVNNPDFYEIIDTDLLNCITGNEPCNNLNCVNGTVTIGIEGNCFCDCEPGWTGPNCDQPITALPVNMQLLAGDGTQGNANGTFGQLNYPQSMVTSVDGTVVYIADGGSKSIRMVNPVNNEVTTLLGGNVEGYLDGSYANARFSSFGDIALDDAGNIYVSDAGNHLIRKISGGQVTTYAGTVTGTGTGGLTNGLASTAQFNSPIGLLIRNNTMYVADNLNGCIRAIAMNDDPNLRTVTTYAGNGNPDHVDGANASASFAGPRDIAYDAFNDRLLVTENYGFGGFTGANVRAVTATQTTTLTIDLPGSQTMLNPAGIAADTDGSFYLTDRQNHVLYHLTDLGGGFYATSTETAGLYQTTGNLGGIPGDSRLNFPNLLYIGTSLNGSSQLETRLYIANVLGQSVWYIPLR